MDPEPTNINPEPTPAVVPTEPAVPAVPSPASADPTLLSTPAPATVPTPAPDAVLTQQISMVKPDGTFVEGWKDKLPEELRGEECLSDAIVKDFPSMVKQYVNQRKAIGKNKVAIPTDKSDENEWNLFYESIGRPKTAIGYNSPEIPDNLKEIFTDERLEQAKQRAYSIGATQKQFDSYLKSEVDDVVTALQDRQEAAAKATREAKVNTEKELRQDLGAAYDEHMHFANRAITESIPKDADRVRFIEKFGNDIDIIRIMSYFGLRGKEHTALVSKISNKTPNEAQARINELNKTPGYMSIGSDMSSEDRQRITDEIQTLTKQLHPVKVG